jgi:hypothetical protein
MSAKSHTPALNDLRPVIYKVRMSESIDHVGLRFFMTFVFTQ